MTGRMAIFHGASRPFELITADVPAPRLGEVLVRVECCTICRSDLHTHAGRRLGPVPTVLGHEVTGRVAAIGDGTGTYADGNALQLGDRVTWCVTVGCRQCFFCRNDLPQKCEWLHKYGHECYSPDNPFCGGFADYQLLASGTNLCRVPDDIPSALAAMSSCATATAVAVAKASAVNLSGKTVLILGAGALGLSACAYAKCQGAAVIVSDPMQSERAISFGATHAASSDPTELGAIVAKVTNDRGADQAWELSGAASAVAASIEQVRIGGTVVLSGTVLPVPPMPLHPEQIVRRMLTIRGVHNYVPRDLAEAISFLAETRTKFSWDSLFGPSYGLQDIEQAFAYAHEHPGVRVAVTPTEG